VYAAGTFGSPPTLAVALTLAMRTVQLIVAVSSGMLALALWLLSVQRRSEPADPWVFGA
jgi:hypothetical protein